MVILGGARNPRAPLALGEIPVSGGPRLDPPISAIIFDLDGTLIDSLALTFRAMREAVRPFLGRDLSDQEIYALFGPADHEIVASLVRPEEAGEARHRLMAAYRAGQDEIRLYPGIHGVLGALRRRGLRLGLCTGRGRPSTDLLLGPLGLAESFEVVVTGEDVPRPKPEPDGILETARRMQLDPSRILYTGDSIKDVEAGLAAGAFTVAALWGGVEEHTAGFERAHALAHRPDDLLPIVEARGVEPGDKE